MHHSDRLVPVKTTHSAMPIYMVMSLDLSAWLHKAFEKVMKGFLWSGSDEVQGGKCLVAWSRVQRPLDLGRLGVLDLRLLGHALRVRWLWLQCTDPS
jgi:hypothetical protein